MRYCRSLEKIVNIFCRNLRISCVFLTSKAAWRIASSSDEHVIALRELVGAGEEGGTVVALSKNCKFVLCRNLRLSCVFLASKAAWCIACSRDEHVIALQELVGARQEGCTVVAWRSSLARLLAVLQSLSFVVLRVIFLATECPPVVLFFRRSL